MPQYRRGALVEKIMTGAMIDLDCFSKDLTAKLAAALSGTDASSLPRVVADCAATAEAACCGRQMACAAGCPHCCVLNVAILFPEAMVIAGWLQEQLSSPELEAVRQRLAAHNSRGRWMEDEERIARQVACPLLDSAGNCSIHPVRPLVCRGVSSLDEQCCREAFNPIISDQERLVPADLLRRAAFDEAFKSLAQVLRHHQLDDRSIELGAGIRAFLTHPGYCERFLSGEQMPRELWD